MDAAAADMAEPTVANDEHRNAHSHRVKLFVLALEEIYDAGPYWAQLSARSCEPRVSRQGGWWMLGQANIGASQSRARACDITHGLQAFEGRQRARQLGAGKLRVAAVVAAAIEARKRVA